MEFRSLPYEERVKWLLFEEMERKRKEYFDKKEQEAIKKQRSKIRNPKTRKIR